MIGMKQQACQALWPWWHLALAPHPKVAHLLSSLPAPGVGPRSQELGAGAHEGGVSHPPCPESGPQLQGPGVLCRPS